jgi:hypothetical protein
MKMRCFVIMPFAESFDPVFKVVNGVAATAVQDITFECHWMKDVFAAGRITDDLVRALDEATFCIADVSGNNPNVMWETGYAMALGKPTILIAQDIACLPFDLKTHRVLSYEVGNPEGLKKNLAKAIRDTLARYELKGAGKQQSHKPAKASQKTVAVSGSMRAIEASVNRKVEVVLSPYLSETTLWLTGSVGTVDVNVIRFLLEKNQNICAVGYHRFDCDPAVRQLIKEERVRFIDASVETIPKGIKGPSERDILFCIKSDLVILFWDGKSEGTKNLVDYYQNQGVATLLAFV